MTALASKTLHRRPIAAVARAVPAGDHAASLTLAAMTGALAASIALGLSVWFQPWLF